jgi:hypothetical protein
MAKRSIDDCRCRLQRASDGKYEVLQYNPRCTFHKGPDAGYGYDEWGRPNGKHSKRIGTIGAAIFVGLLLLLAAWSIYKVLSIS